MIQSYALSVDKFDGNILQSDLSRDLSPSRTELVCAVVQFLKRNDVSHILRHVERHLLSSTR